MDIDSVVEKIYELASKQDAQGNWLYGRNKLKNMFPDISEWKIRTIIQEIRGLGPAGSAPMTSVQKTKKEREEKLLNTKIVIKVPKLKPRTNVKKSPVEKWVIASDFHSPYQHESSCDIFYQIVEDEQPDKVILLGDVVNLNTFSKYDKDPTGPTWIEDVASAGKILGLIKQAAPNATLEWRKGNHEDRLKKHLMRHDPILYSFLTLENLFIISGNEDAANSMKLFSFIDKNEEVFEDLNLVIKHGDKVRKNSGRSVGAELENLWMSVVIGHCHRLGITIRSSGRSRYKDEFPAFGMEVGCMCRFDLDYIEGNTTDWQHGFGILTIDKSDETPVIDPTLVQIKNGKAIHKGRVYRA